MLGLYNCAEFHKTPHTDQLNKDGGEKRRTKRRKLKKREKVARLISGKSKQNKGRPKDEKREINNTVRKWSEATRVCSENALDHTQPDVLRSYSSHAFVQNAERRLGEP